LCHLFRPPAEVIAEYKDKGDFEMQANEEAIMSLIKRRPCAAEDIAGAFGMHLNEVCKYLGNFLRQGRIGTERMNGSFYYKATIQEQMELCPALNTVVKDAASDFEATGAFRKD
jgi:hypothetical protein